MSPRALSCLAAGAMVLGLWPQFDESLTAYAEGPREPESPVADHHRVGHGDTLWLLAERYLGDPWLWPTLAELNPSVPNPDLLLPGQLLRIAPAGKTDPATAAKDEVPSRPTVPDEVAEPTLPAVAESAETSVAVVADFEHRVEEQRPPSPWQRTRKGNELDRGHAVRTFEQSSAELDFFDGARLSIAQSSLVFLRDRKVRRRDRGGAIEIVEGQTDVHVEQVANTTPLDVELQLEQTTAHPEGTGESFLRARRGEDGSAQFMAFEGRLRVTAEGEDVVLESGTGTIVAPSLPPGEPQVLLAAPVVLPVSSDPTAKSIVLSWQPLADAVAYDVEVCPSPSCGIQKTRALVTEASWTPPELPPGTYFWRVSGVSESGLDGQPSSASPLTIESPPPERAPADADGTGSSPSLWLILIAMGAALLLGWLWLRRR